MTQANLPSLILSFAWSRKIAFPLTKDCFKRKYCSFPSFLGYRRLPEKKLRIVGVRICGTHGCLKANKQWTHHSPRSRGFGTRLWPNHSTNRPFPISPQSPFQSKAKCEVCYENQFSFILKLELIIITKVLHLDSLWKRDWGELGNGLLGPFLRPRAAFPNTDCPSPFLSKRFPIDE